jgi:hypothetical protein
VITTNAQGQVTGVTPTAIAISGAAVSGNISGSAGSVANALTAGTFLTSGGTFDGSAARTFAVDATDANTASKVVARDASGNFSAGTITATLSGSATSATTATNLAGGAANRIAYQTSAGISDFITAPTASNQVLNWNGSAFTWSAGTISGIALGSNLATLTFGTFLTGTSYNGSGAVTLATNATNLNTASTIVARDASGNFTAGTITAALSGNATTSSSTSGNAATATALQTARTINGVSFNGTANITVADSTKLPLAGGTLTGNLTVSGAGAAILKTTGDITAYRSGGTTGVIFLNSAENRYLYYDGTAYQLNVASLVVGGNVTAYSDERLKKDWSPLPADFIERLAKVKAGTYTRIDSGERQAGSSAQEWQKLLPEVVMESTDEAKTLALAYGNAALVAAVKLAERAVKLAERVVALEARIAALEAKG